MRADGYCESCGHWALEYPNLLCPWHQAAVVTDPCLDLNPDEDPKAIMNAVVAELRVLYLRGKALKAVRARAARAVLAQPTRVAAAKLVGRMVRTLERWATMDDPVLRPPRPERRKPEPSAAALRDPARMAAAQDAYAKRLERQERILALREKDHLPGPLRPPLPDPQGAVPQ